MFQNRWGNVSEKLPTGWRNDSEKSHTPKLTLEQDWRPIEAAPDTAIGEAGRWK
jgi:hypothetical protein